MEIKRGMCFYLDEPSKTEPVPCTADVAPQKKRPYMVLSNDKCNASSQLVHVAPILSRVYDPKRWYCVPFKSTNNRDAVVDISAIMLVDKTLLTEAAYTAAISFYTLTNKILMDDIRTAIKRQFALDDAGTRYDQYKIADHETMSTTTKTSQVDAPTIPEIHLTINLNGVPINTTVPMNNSDVAVDVPAIPETELVIDTPKLKKKIARVVAEDIKKSVDNDKVMKLNGGVGKKFTEKEKEYINTYIKKNHRSFGGKMKPDDISTTLGISLSTVNRYARTLKAPRQRAKKSTLPKKLYEQFYEDYVRNGAKYVVEKYHKYGFKTVQQVYNVITRNKYIQELKKLVKTT